MGLEREVVQRAAIGGDVLQRVVAVRMRQVGGAALAARLTHPHHRRRPAHRDVEVRDLEGDVGGTLDQLRHPLQALRTGFSSTPIPSTSAAITSPGTRKRPRAAPTPAQVPVEITSPGTSGTTLERYAISSWIEKTICEVLESCISSPWTRSASASAPGDGQSRAGSSQGPDGQLVPHPFWPNQS